MKLSVIVCTYRRLEPLSVLLQCLSRQSCADFELLLIDGAGEVGYRETSAALQKDGAGLNARVISSPKGLTRQRNAGLAAARGEIICFLDDDVAFAEKFLSDALGLFSKPEMAHVGGVTGYDTVNYPTSINGRWRLRRALRILPSLTPGDIDRLGFSVPVSFFKPFQGCQPVGFFYGFCMFYRRAAIEGLWFDEHLPTYGGEDRDFSFRVSRRHPLMLSGDLQLQHFRSAQSRDSLVARTFQTGFGAGRTFAKHAKGPLDSLRLIWSAVGEFLVDSLAFLQAPSSERFRMPFARLAGTWKGSRSNPLPVNDRVVSNGTLCQVKES